MSVEPLKTGLAAWKAAGSPRVSRAGRSKAIRTYLRELHGVDDNYGDDRAACREEYAKALAEIKGQSAPSVVKTFCTECVGADDPGVINRIKGCCCKDCPLHSFRPYRKALAKPQYMVPPGGSIKDAGVQP